MTAKIGTVNLPYGVQEETPNYRNKLAVTDVPLGSPILQQLGRAATSLYLRAAVTKSVLESLIKQHQGSPMVTFDIDDTGKGDTDAYGIITESLRVLRTSRFPELYFLEIQAYRLDFDVENISYDLTNGDYELEASSQLVTDDTDEQIDDYVANLVIKSDKQVRFYLQYSPDKSTWSDYPTDLYWDVENEMRVININNISGYVRVVAANSGSETATINARLYLSKQKI